MTTSLRCVHVAFSLAAIASLAVGCAAGAGDERTEDTSQAATKCLTCDGGITTTQPDTIGTKTTPADPYAPQTCITAYAVVPPGLAGRNCTYGYEYSDQTAGNYYFAFACPAGFTPPAALLSSPDSYWVEHVSVVTGGVDNKCFGNPDSGWEIVLDSLYWTAPPPSPGCTGTDCDIGSVGPPPSGLIF